MKIGIVGFLVLGLWSCENESSKPKENREINPTEEVVQKDTSELLFQSVLEKHGGSRYDSAHYRFVFRKVNYSFKNSGSDYNYAREFQKDGQNIKDRMGPDSFIREVDGSPIELSGEDILKYRSSLNSVIYFATLPHKLADASVKREIVGKDSVDGHSYFLMKVSFKKEGGGEDFDDEYMYWINSQSKTMDYFAYNYQVNGGGVRFRSFYNRRQVEGIIFQDYINYEAPIGTALIDLAHLKEKGELTELSRILSEEIESINEI